MGSADKIIVFMLTTFALNAAEVNSCLMNPLRGIQPFAPLHLNYTLR
jgi:hypothetical protein